jgi:hypothetical protein
MRNTDGRLLGPLIVAFLVVLVGMLVACGGGNDSDSDEGDGAEDDLAASMLLTVEDFPSGWSEDTSDDEDEDHPFDRCEAEGDPEGLTGRAESGDFSEGGAAEISEYVAVFATADQASDAVAAGFDDERKGCIVEVIETGELDEDDVQYTDASISDLSFPNKGDESFAVRMEIHAETDEDDIEADVFLDVVYVSYDRVVFRIFAADVLSPFNIDELEGVVDDALAKVRAQIGAADASPRPSATPGKTRAPADTSEPSPKGDGRRDSE